MADNWQPNEVNRGFFNNQQSQLKNFIKQIKEELVSNLENAESEFVILGQKWASKCIEKKFYNCCFD